MIKLMKAIVYVFSDSVLCVGKVREYPQSNIDRRNKLECFKSTNQYRELDGIDGEPVEFEWSILPGHTTLEFVQEIQASMRDLDGEPEDFQGRILSCRCTTTSTGETRITNAYVWQMPQWWVAMQQDSPWVIGHFLNPVQKRNGMQQIFSSLEVNGTELQNS